ncbi:hypothetical protein DXG01_001982 [Tephrocybe rancida]|nr:hypothetical protein DXG01_001982 [Tephrocybe rancida]
MRPQFQADDYVESVVGDGIFAHCRCHTNNLIRSSLDHIFKVSQPTEAHPHGTYGTNDSGKGQKVVVELSSPDIAKPFHAGHLRSLLVVGFERYGSEASLTDNAIMHLFSIYVAINKDVTPETEANPGRPSPTNEQAKQVFCKMEDGDEKVLALWSRFRALSIKAYKKVYECLNVKLDVYGGESLVKSEGINLAIMLKTKNMLATKTAKESESRVKQGPEAEAGSEGAPVEDEEEEDAPAGALVLAVDLTEWKMGKPVVQKGDGTTVYITRDVAGALQ